jgi:hypothetical protein
MVKIETLSASPAVRSEMNFGGSSLQFPGYLPV